MSLRLCNHLKANGQPCRSPALRGQRFCYFHLDPVARRLKAAWARAYCVLRMARERQRAVRRRSMTRKLVSS